jgi:hypothetical protein
VIEAASKEKESASTMATWLKVKGNTFKGAVCPAEKSEIDFSVKGRKRDGEVCPNSCEQR